MPCYDPPPDYQRGFNDATVTDDYKLRCVQNDLRRVEAILCGICRVLAKAGTLDDVVFDIDTSKAGVSRQEIIDWIVAHRDRDAAKGEEP